MGGCFIVEVAHRAERAMSWFAPLPAFVGIQEVVIQEEDDITILALDLCHPQPDAAPVELRSSYFDSAWLAEIGGEGCVDFSVRCRVRGRDCLPLEQVLDDRYGTGDV